MTIYFDNDKNAYGYEIENPLATVEDTLWDKVCSDRAAWDIINGQFVDLRETPEYQEILKQREKERIGNLTCTKRVLVKMLQQLQYSWKDVIKPLIYSNDDAAMEWELCVELQRKNPLIDLMASQLGITPEQIDQLFKYANNEVESLEV